MSADLALIALPDTEQWRATWNEFNAAEITGDMDDEEIADWAGRGIVAMTSDRHRELITALFNQPNIEVGQVSALKASLFGDADRYVPGPIDRVAALLGDDGQVLTPGLVKALTVAYNLPNRSIYGHVQYHRLTDPSQITFHREQSRIGTRMYGRFIEPNILQYGKGRGLIRPRHLKAWLGQHVGQRIVGTLV